MSAFLDSPNLDEVIHLLAQRKMAPMAANFARSAKATVDGINASIDEGNFASATSAQIRAVNNIEDGAEKWLKRCKYSSCYGSYR